MTQVFDISTHADIDPARSVLLFELGMQYCAIAVLKQDGYEAQRLVYYEGSDEEQLLQNVIAAHQEFSVHFADVLINYSFPQSIMTPSKFYNLEDGKKMLGLMYGNEKEMAVLSEHLPELQLYNVYEVPKHVHGWINRQFRSGKYWHNYSTALKTLSADEQAETFFIDFKTRQFSIIIFKAGQLQLAQTFGYTEPEDVLYYLLKICSLFSISTKEVSLVLSGLIQHRSLLYTQLYDYFIKVSFKKNPDTIKMPHPFMHYSEHFFSSFFNLITCAS